MAVKLLWGLLIVVLLYTQSTALELQGANNATITSSTPTTLTGQLYGTGTGINAIPNVATGQVLTSGTPAAWSPTPTLTGIGLGGATPLTTASLFSFNTTGPGLIIRPGTDADSRMPFAVLENPTNDPTAPYIVKTFINSSGAPHTRAWMTISGNMSAAVDGITGAFSLSSDGAPAATYMLGIWSDVDAPTAVLRLGSASSNQSHIQFRDNAGLYEMRIAPLGFLKWGTSASVNSEDTGLRRCGAGCLEQNTATASTLTGTQFTTGRISVGTTTGAGTDGVLLFVNNGAIAFKDTGGTGRNVIQLDNGNTLTISNPSASPGHIKIVAPSGSAQVQVLNNAQSVNLFVVDAPNSKFGFLTNAPTATLGIDGTAARTLGLNRHTTANTAGNNFTINAGGATSGATDKNGGDLILNSGVSTGTGTSSVILKAYPAGSTGTTDATLTTHLTVGSKKATFDAGIVAGGTKFTITGCSAGTTTGGAFAGTFVSGTTGACTVVITLNGATGITAPNGWTCHANNLTTTANLIQQSASSTTTCTVTGTTVTGDVISFMAMAY